MIIFRCTDCGNDKEFAVSFNGNSTTAKVTISCKVCNSAYVIDMK